MGWRFVLPYVIAFVVAVLSAGAALYLALHQAAGSRELLSRVTGGESFSYLEPLRQPNYVRYFVRHAGDHPTYDVVIRIQKIISVEGQRKRHLIFGPADVGRTLIGGSGFDWTYPTVDSTPDQREWPLVFPEPSLGCTPPQEFRIEMAARNGVIVQRLRIWREGDRVYTFSKWIKRPGRDFLALPANFKEAQEREVKQPGDEDDDVDENWWRDERLPRR